MGWVVGPCKDFALVGPRHHELSIFIFICFFYNYYLSNWVGKFVDIFCLLAEKKCEKRKEMMKVELM